MSVKNIVRKIVPGFVLDLYHWLQCRIKVTAARVMFLFFGKKISDYKKIPIIINNYNRLTYLKALIASLESRGYSNIYIIDNKSTYQPLLDYYAACSYKIFCLNENLGYLALWKSGIFKQFRRSYYVYTDSDMCIDEQCPADFMQKFVGIIKDYPMSEKAGFGIRTDDLPDYFKNKQKVIEHEAGFWKKQVEEGVYRAGIDTTFALYRPFCGGKAVKFQESYRTGSPYIIRHLPWYVDSSELSEEEKYYINSITHSTHWSKQA